MTGIKHELRVMHREAQSIQPLTSPDSGPKSIVMHHDALAKQVNPHAVEHQKIVQEPNLIQNRGLKLIYSHVDERIS